MTFKTHTGSCHCGAVRFEADVDLEAGTNRCNCSYCTKARAWFTFAKGAGRFRLLEGKETVTEYRWTPPGSSGPGLTYGFCSRCGSRIFGTGELEVLGGVFHAVPVNVIDDVSPEQLAALPINYIDNRHDRPDRAPEITSYL